jgi:diadenosine tetraphosphatase ApaH/serine/threonine PP2A family protein phosphatase
MRYAIISDIHSNLVALETCLKVIDDEGVDLIVCLGDIVGYGASPNECVELVRERSRHVVIGNHDAAVVGTTETDYFNHDARSAVMWTREALSPENSVYLRSLPYTCEIGDILLVHSSPSAPPDWEYIFHVREAMREFATFFVERDDDYTQLAPPSILIQPGDRAMVNVGSVGQPRDGDPRAAFAFYDDATGEVEIRRVFYDVERVRERILDTELPRSAAERLVWGV